MRNAAVILHLLLKNKKKKKKKARSDTAQTDASFVEDMMMMMMMDPPHGVGGNCPVLTLLPTALHIYILSFLPEPDLYRVMQVNRTWSRLLLLNENGTDRHHQDDRGEEDEGGDYLWQCLLEQQWPFLKSQPLFLSSDNNNKRLLLKLAADTFPSAINADRLAHQLSFVTVEEEHNDRHSTNEEEEDKHNDKANMIRFTGPTGAGDRSFRANAPLPRPHYRTTQPACRPGPLRWYSRLWSWRRPTAVYHYQPFVVPFRQGTHDGFVMTPRMISYFEASILDLNHQPQGYHGRSHTSSSSSPVNITTNNNRECVAVGLSTYRFEMHRRLPGWDSWSFGYHGDDGFAFHHTSGGIKYGPTFGAGSVVGCGIDYHCRRVFYTLNGQFLGYAPGGVLTAEQLALDWFPTVGLDSHAAVQCNFGRDPDKPFGFDLAAMVQYQNQKHEAGCVMTLYDHGIKTAPADDNSSTLTV